MTVEHGPSFDDLERRVGFANEDAANLQALGALFEQHGGRLISEFEAALSRGGLPEERIRLLVEMYRGWLGGLCVGPYDERYFTTRLTSGARLAHLGVPREQVRQGVLLVRSRALGLLAVHLDDLELLSPGHESLMRLLDLELALLDLAYEREPF